MSGYMDCTAGNRKIETRMLSENVSETVLCLTTKRDSFAHYVRLELRLLV